MEELDDTRRQLQNVRGVLAEMQSDSERGAREYARGLQTQLDTLNRRAEVGGGRLGILATL